MEITQIDFFLGKGVLFSLKNALFEVYAHKSKKRV